ncbi:flagellar hook-length control protein FliK [Aliirhizobium smilacinae]|uniref:Flagellar hook-length control protein FliK n=1 Tax=Aliirhizobium smilacinae TaxID=1395944 RepID=A0A5C4XSM2_9HYPH|nr:flagellar hook-length control protein FliK [Rhizobium smilacinae]TNM66081.1 flagellar hook-length control protein FliK [Rhizobium smilacinae]
MMNVVNNALPAGADVSTAASSASNKGTRSAKDDGFAKTLNSYGDGQSQRGKTGSASSDDSAATTTQSDQGEAGTDATTSQASSGTRPFAMTVESMLSKATALPSDPVTPETVIEIPVEAPEAAQQAPVDGADLDTATDLLADLQAAMPANTKGQGNTVRSTTADQAKTDQTDTDAADPDAADDALALLQALPDVAAAQTAQSDVVGDQQTTQTPSTEIDVGSLASQAGNAAQPLKDAAPEMTTNTAASDVGKAVKSSAAAAAEAVPAVRDALEHDSEVSADIETPAVQVTENRRYIGIAPSSNAVSLATAFGQDPDWSAAMNPSAKLSNEALYASTGKVVNTLKIELNPNDLGHVTATMRMVGEELNIHLTVESSKAYRQLLHDSSSMLDNLKAQGYSVDQITVSIASGSSSTSSDKGSDSFANGRQSSDMGQAQQQQQQNGRQGGSTTTGHLTDTSETGARGSSSGGKDEGLAQGAGSGGAGARPDTVYL